jgi:hypothetical protein
VKDMATQLVYTPVPKAFVGAIWDEVVRVLGRSVATSRGKYSMEDLYKGIMAHDYVLWVVLDDDKIVAAITSRVVRYSDTQQGMALDWIGGKRMTEWLPMVQRVMSKYARDNGCTHLEGFGRKAWGRVLANYGWKPEYIAYRMELSDG